MRSSEFGVDVLENWQSEYLQFSLFILGTVWLIQRGSPESKEPDKAGGESDEDQKRRRARDRATRRAGRASAAGARALYSNSLLLVMGDDLARSPGSASRSPAASPTTPSASTTSRPRSAGAQYVGTPDFWNRTLQNWQSEFLAVGSMAVLAIYLRQRGSPESKPVGAPHDATGTEG